jgi:hypothetical protein
MEPTAAAFQCWFHSCHNAEHVAFLGAVGALVRAGKCVKQNQHLQHQRLVGDGRATSVIGTRWRGTMTRSPGTSAVLSAPLLTWVTDQSGT